MIHVQRFTCITLCMLMAACSSGWHTQEGGHAPLSTNVNYVAHSPTWREQVQHAYARANAFVTQYAAAHPQQSWAVIMDLDQTVLNNIEYHAAIDRAGKTHNEADWDAWTKARRAVLMPHARDFIARVKTLGGKVAFVTNRHSTQEAATEENLAALGIVRGRDFQALLTHDITNPSRDKNARFARVPSLLAAQGFHGTRVIAHVGDVVGDAPRPLGRTRFFCIPQGGLYGENC